MEKERNTCLFTIPEKKHRNELPHYYSIRSLFKHASYGLERGTDSKALFLRFVEESFVLIKKNPQMMDSEHLVAELVHTAQ
jgi:hypothetical protein